MRPDMIDGFAALPMYDWPEMRAATDAEWAGIRDALIAQGFSPAPELVRRNGDLPPVPGGIRDAAGHVIAPDPSTLPPDGLDLHALWRHPKLVFAQTCWGPMEQGLAAHVAVIGQPDYSDCEGGTGHLYSSAVVARGERSLPAPADGRPMLPVERLRGASFACNSPDSMSGLLALSRDLEAAGESFSIFAARIETGGHRASLRAVAGGEADIAAIDCRSWQLARRFEPAARDLCVVGWTARRPGLPFIRAAGLAGPRAVGLTTAGLCGS